LTTVRLYSYEWCAPHTYYIEEKFDKVINEFPAFKLLIFMIQLQYLNVNVRPRVSVMDSSGVYRDLNYQVLKDPENRVNIAL
jgi:hypothetical protein